MTANYCSNCGEAVQGGAKFCGSCGNALTESNQQPRDNLPYVPAHLTIEYDFDGPLQASDHFVNRLLLFVKWLLMIPIYIYLVLYGLATFIITFLAFWVILFTGRYPERFFPFVSGYLEDLYKTYAYFPLLITNHYLPDRMHPIETQIDYPESCSRLVLVFLKLPSFLLSIIGNLAGIALLIQLIIAIPIWFIILFTGKYPKSWLSLNEALLQWHFRANVWVFLLRDDASLFGTTQTVKVLFWVGVVGSVLFYIISFST